MQYVTNTLSLIVRPKGEAIFHEAATVVEIDDEAAGPFIKIMQQQDRQKLGEITVDRDCWPSIRDAVEQLLKECDEIEGDMAHKERMDTLGLSD